MIRQGRYIPFRPPAPSQSPTPQGRKRKSSQTAQAGGSSPLSLERLIERTRAIEEPAHQVSQQPVRRTLFIKHLRGCLFHDGYILGIGKDHPNPPKFKRKSRLECNCAKIISGEYDAEREEEERRKENIDRHKDKKKITLEGKVCAILSWSSSSEGSSDEAQEEDERYERKRAALPLVKRTIPNKAKAPNAQKLPEVPIIPKTPFKVSNLSKVAKVREVPRSDGYEGDDESPYCSDTEIEDQQHGQDEDNGMEGRKQNNSTGHEDILIQSASSGRTIILPGMTTDEEVEQESDIDTDIENPDNIDPDETDEYELPSAPHSYHSHSNVNVYIDEDETEEEILDDDGFCEEKGPVHQHQTQKKQTILRPTSNHPTSNHPTSNHPTSNHYHTCNASRDQEQVSKNRGPRKALWFPVTQWEHENGYSDLPIGLHYRLAPSLLQQQ